MRYHVAPIFCRPWLLNGLSQRLIESHYENNYGGALNRLNAISEEIERLDLGNAPNPSLARLKRDEIVALPAALQQALAARLLGVVFLPPLWALAFVGIAIALAWFAAWMALSRVLRGVGP